MEDSISRKVEVRISIRATPQEVMSAFVDPVKLSGWWQVERALIDPHPGGAYTLAWLITDKGIGYVSTGVIKEYKFDTRLIIDNLVYLSIDKSFLGPMTLTMEVKEKGSKTELYLCQDGYQQGEEWDWYYHAVKEAWPKVLLSLKNFLENEKN